MLNWKTNLRTKQYFWYKVFLKNPRLGPIIVVQNLVLQCMISEASEASPTI